MAGVRFFILTAVVPEARALARAFQLVKSKAAVPCWIRGEMAVAVVGVRAGRIEAVGNLLARYSPQVIVMAGVAGGLSPALRVGDVVVHVAERRGAEGGEGDAGRGQRAEGRGLAALPALGGAFVGPMHTAERIAATPAEKARLFAATGCLATDMETDIAAQFAAAYAAKQGANQTGHAVAFVAMRGISDSAEESLDPALLTLVDAAGRPRIGAAFAMLCRHPTRLRAMLQLGRSTAVAMQSVARTLRLLEASGWPDDPENSSR